MFDVRGLGRLWFKRFHRFPKFKTFEVRHRQIATCNTIGDT